MSDYNQMSADEMREILARLGVSQAGFARWLGITGRAVRRYVSQGKAKNARAISPEMAILLRLLDERPELLLVLERHFAKDEGAS